VISVYAPSFAPHRSGKDEFYDDLMCTINSVCQDDMLLVVGDFNARVGSNQLLYIRTMLNGVMSGVFMVLAILTKLGGYF